MHRGLVTAYLVITTTIVPALGQSKVEHTAQGASPSADLATIVARMEQAQAANRQHFNTFSIVRDYRLYGEDESKANSEVVARINFIPPDTKTYQIEKSNGTDRGEKLVRRVLDKESKSDPGTTALTRENYEFAYVGADTVEGHRCYVLGIHPKHRREDLVEGRAWIDVDSYLPRQLEGDLSKNPSWWLKKVHLTLTFANVNGLWLQDNTRATAEVRLFGRHIFTSRMLGYSSSADLAQNRAPAAPKAVRRPMRPAPAIAGAGIFTRQ